MTWIIVGGLVSLALITVKRLRNLPTPKEMHALLIKEPLTRYPYTQEHIRKCSVAGKPPRFFVGNERAKVAYWRTKRVDRTSVETIAFFHAKKKGDVRVTFLNGKFEIWTHDGASGRPVNQEELGYLTHILDLIKNFAP